MYLLLENKNGGEFFVDAPANCALQIVLRTDRTE